MVSKKNNYFKFRGSKNSSSFSSKANKKYNKFHSVSGDSSKNSSSGSRFSRYKFKRFFSHFDQVVISYYQAKNNFFFVGRSRFGRTFFSFSGGLAKLRSTKRYSYRSAELIVNKLVIPRLKMLKFSSIIFELKTPIVPNLRLLVNRVSRFFRVSAIYDRVPVSFNKGVRQKKQRRV